MKILRKRTSTTLAILIAILTVTSALFVGLAIRSTSADGGSGSTTSTPATFTNYELGGNPFNTPNFSQGTVCPNAYGTCQNTEGEPSIRADPSGNFYGSSENVFCVIGGLCGGTFAWSSTDGGAHFKTLTLPNSVSSGSVPPTCNPNTDHCNGPGLSPAGGDTDIAVAPRRNANGFYNIYVSSLQSKPPLLNVYVSTSKDGGATWSINPTGASIPVDDREWIAADGANKVCISYHAQPATNEIVVDCSYDAGLTFTQHALAFDTPDQFNALFNNAIGNLALDPGNHVIYQAFSSIHDLNEQIACGASCHTHTVWIAVSTDGGKTFTDYIVYNNPNTGTDYGHQFVNVSVDMAGNVYLLYNDNHNLFYSFSKTFGQTWSGPYQINKPSSNTAIFPWGSAGSNGALDVVWYGTSFYDGVTIPDNYPMTAAWYVYFSQNLAATTPNSPWTQVLASGIVHYGGVCESGVTCTGNRDLLDDFGVAASPTTGLAAIIYTNDQYMNTAAEPATKRNDGSSVCSGSLSNSVDCSHTDIAIQTAGSTLTKNKHHFETDEHDFEEMDLNNDGNHSPHFEMDETNTGSVAITSITTQINGQPLNLAWSTVYPLQPGQTATASTTSVPSTLLLAIGNIYSVTITATLADGTTETQTSNIVYTLGAGIGL
jgi:hypothetical protein